MPRHSGAGCTRRLQQAWNLPAGHRGHCTDEAQAACNLAHKCAIAVDKASGMCYTVGNRIGPIIAGEEGEAMKRHWVRGLWWGVSLALLVAGGVALAEDSFFARVLKTCVDCWPGPGDPTQDRYLLPVELGGWDTNYDLCTRITIDGILFELECTKAPTTTIIKDTFASKSFSNVPV